MLTMMMLLACVDPKPQPLPDFMGVPQMGVTLDGAPLGEVCSSSLREGAEWMCIAKVDGNSVDVHYEVNDGGKLAKVLVVTEDPVAALAVKEAATATIGRKPLQLSKYGVRWKWRDVVVLQNLDEATLRGVQVWEWNP